MMIIGVKIANDWKFAENVKYREDMATVVVTHFI